jgi:hypothetical protein
MGSSWLEREVFWAKTRTFPTIERFRRAVLRWRPIWLTMPRRQQCRWRTNPQPVPPTLLDPARSPRSALESLFSTRRLSDYDGLHENQFDPEPISWPPAGSFVSALGRAVDGERREANATGRRLRGSCTLGGG